MGGEVVIFIPILQMRKLRFREVDQCRAALYAAETGWEPSLTPELLLLCHGGCSLHQADGAETKDDRNQV